MVIPEKTPCVSTLPDPMTSPGYEVNSIDALVKNGLSGGAQNTVPVGRLRVSPKCPDEASYPLSLSSFPLPGSLPLPFSVPSVSVPSLSAPVSSARSNNPASGHPLTTRSITMIKTVAIKFPVGPVLLGILILSPYSSSHTTRETISATCAARRASSPRKSRYANSPARAGSISLSWLYERDTMP